MMETADIDPIKRPTKTRDPKKPRSLLPSPRSFYNSVVAAGIAPWSKLFNKLK